MSMPLQVVRFKVGRSNQEFTITLSSLGSIIGFQVWIRRGSKELSTLCIQMLHILAASFPGHCSLRFVELGHALVSTLKVLFFTPSSPSKHFAFWFSKIRFTLLQSLFLAGMSLSSMCTTTRDASLPQQPRASIANWLPPPALMRFLAWCACVATTMLSKDSDLSSPVSPSFHHTVPPFPFSPFPGETLETFALRFIFLQSAESFATTSHTPSVTLQCSPLLKRLALLGLGSHVQVP
mmetsp:Transcript_2914/g.5969  ORF Transcript_2914/g.5969 Transcript_2914/m.5969 type:complete len:237 (-) Transcript_2914:696-1406(-)